MLKSSREVKTALRSMVISEFWSFCSTYGNLYSLKKRRLEQSKAETMLYVHTNLNLIYRQREEWLKGKTKMWDVYPYDMGLDNSVELA
jgi:hypothetical protein